MKMSLNFGRLGSVLLHRINRNRINNSGGFLDSVGVPKSAACFGFGRFSSGSVRTFSSSPSSSSSAEEELSEWYTPIASKVYVNASIESIKLKINDKSKGPRQIYGEIKLPRKFTLTYLFRRHRDEAQLVPDDDDSDGFPLILCGPNHTIRADPICEYINVDLYDENRSPFITGKFVLIDNMKFGGGRFQIPIQEHVYTPDASARLTLTYTRIHHSHPAIFQFRLIPNSSGCSVSGTIRGIHRVPEGTTTNWITIFDSRGEAVAVPEGEPIPLDRFYFIVPVQTGKQGEEGFRGGSFDIDVDLQLHTKFKLFSIKGQANVVFNRLDSLGERKFFTVGRPSDGPVIQISVENFYQCWPDGDIEQTLEH